MMKRIFLFVFLFTGFSTLPALTFAQVTNKANAKQKAGLKTNETVKKTVATDFTINGTVTGFTEGTTVEFLNGQTGATELSTTTKDGKFILKGKMERPDFRIVIFNRQPPYITLFMDNSVVNITGDKATIDKAKVTGSESHTSFEQFNNSLEPYQTVFAEGGEYDSAMTAKAMKLMNL
jgi:hypothetical protein